MIRKRKRYSKPLKPFESTRIKKENLLLEKYGLKNKREIWKAKEKVKRIREEAIKFLTATKEEQELFLSRLKKLGFVGEKARIDDALAINEETIFNRRLQTIVLKKEIAKTAKGARQLVVHGHIKIGERTVDIPSYLVSKKEEQETKIKEKTKNKKIEEKKEKKQETKNTEEEKEKAEQEKEEKQKTEEIEEKEEK